MEILQTFKRANIAKGFISLFFRVLPSFPNETNHKDDLKKKTHVTLLVE
jgi:hypothetical protein